MFRFPVVAAVPTFALRASVGKLLVPVVPVVLLVPVVATVPSLSPETLKAYERYVSLTEQRINSERDGKSPLLWIDRQPEAERARALARMKRGEAVVAAMETRDAGKRIRVKDGIIHHWVGTVLVPGVKADRVLALVRDYPKYPQVFAPLMTRATVVTHQDSRDVVALRTVVKKVITVVMDGDYVMEYRQLSPTRAVTTTIATNLHQVTDAGLPSERREPADQTSGYLWRYRMYCALEERPEGTYDQCESLTLTRDVPMLIGWAVGGLVTGIPRDSLSLMVSSTRAALLK